MARKPAKPLDFVVAFNPEREGELHSIARKARHLAFLLEDTPALSSSLEIRDTREALLNKLAKLPADNSVLCDVAGEAAYLVAVLKDPSQDKHLANLPKEVRGPAEGLFGQLRNLGLMDQYRATSGGFRI
ncbi:MAG: hypothetical protein ABSH53_22125 [Holophaga sp.]